MALRENKMAEMNKLENIIKNRKRSAMHIKDETLENSIDKFDNIKKYTSFLPIIISVLAAFATGINVFFDYNYRMQCQEFYKIPGQYFHASANDSIVQVIALTASSALVIYAATLVKTKK
jgi:hypothetical protein